MIVVGSSGYSLIMGVADDRVAKARTIASFMFEFMVGVGRVGMMEVRFKS